MNERSKRVLVAILLFAILSLASGLALGSVAASCTDPGSECNQTSELTDVLNQIVDVVNKSLQYGGFIILIVGAILWFSASVNSERAQTGARLIYTGIATIIFYLGYEFFIGLLSWISGA